MLLIRKAFLSFLALNLVCAPACHAMQVPEGLSSKMSTMRSSSSFGSGTSSRFSSSTNNFSRVSAQNFGMQAPVASRIANPGIGSSLNKVDAIKSYMSGGVNETPALNPSPVPQSPGNTVNVAPQTVISDADLGNIFGSSSVSRMSTQTRSELRSVVQDIGVSAAQTAVNDVSSVMGNNFLDTCNPVQITTIVKSVAAMGPGGLQRAVDGIAANLGMSTGDYAGVLQDKGPFIFTEFSSVIAHAGVDNAVSAVSTLSSLFGQDTMRRDAIGNPIHFALTVGNVCDIGLNNVTGFFDGVQQTLSLSGDERNAFLNSIVKWDAEIFFSTLRDVGVDTAAQGIRELTSVFGRDAACGALCDHPLTTIEITGKLSALGEAGLSGFLNDMGSALGVSGKDVAGIFCRGPFLNITSLYNVVTTSSDIGVNRSCDYLGQMASIYTGKALMPLFSENPDVIAKSLETVEALGGMDSFVDSLSATNARSDVIYALQDMGAAALTRFHAGDLGEVVQNRITNADDRRPLAVVIFPSSDHNGAFTSDKDVFHDLIGHGYRLMYYESSTDTEALVDMQNATHNGQTPSQVLILGGHGSQSTLRLSQQAGEEATIDFSDFQQFTSLNEMVAPGSTVILMSCSNGKGLNNEANLANMVSQLVPNAAHVYAQTEDSNISTISFGRDNSVTNVQYWCPAYDAAQYNTSFTFSGADNQTLAKEIMEAFYQVKHE